MGELHAGGKLGWVIPVTGVSDVIIGEGFISCFRDGVGGSLDGGPGRIGKKGKD